MHKWNEWPCVLKASAATSGDHPILPGLWLFYIEPRPPTRLVCNADQPYTTSGVASLPPARGREGSNQDASDQPTNLSAG
jgi:hypothetical protein